MHYLKNKLGRSEEQNSKMKEVEIDDHNMWTAVKL
jgi:hypothetical protein